MGIIHLYSFNQEKKNILYYEQTLLKTKTQQ